MFLEKSYVYNEVSGVIFIKVLEKHEVQTMLPGAV